MLYIITYATHTERYLNILKQSCPDLIVLGMNQTWNGFSDKVNATVNFCKSKNDHDIICFVDGFDSVVLSSKTDILKKYNEFQIPLVMSAASTASSVRVKYIQDKLFGKCKQARLNSGLFIGTAKSIIHFWEEFMNTDDDQTYATNRCASIDYLKIDTDQTLFYNYSSADSIHIHDKSVHINNKHVSIISCPGNNDINHILSQLKYNNLPIIKYDVMYRVKQYARHFIPEFILFILLGYVLYRNQTMITIAFMVCIFVFMEYELYIKHMDISKFRKLSYLILDGIHIIVLFGLVYLFLNFDCNLFKLMCLNLFYACIVLFFFIFKRCILTIWANKLTNTVNVPWNSPQHRLKYLFSVHEQYSPISVPKKMLTVLWINSNKPFFFSIIALNAICLWKHSFK